MLQGFGIAYHVSFENISLSLSSFYLRLDRLVVIDLQVSVTVLSITSQYTMCCWGRGCGQPAKLHVVDNKQP